MPRSSNRPLVTVVMPAYNASRFIREAIESVLNQNFRNFELIVIDDCSADDTYLVAKEYQKDARVRLFRNGRRMGDAATRNRILKLSRGKYIAPHDADDIMLQGRLKDQCAFLEKHPRIGVVFGKAIIVDEGLKKILDVIVPRNENSIPIGRPGVVKRLPNGFNHGTATIRKKFVFKAGLYEASLPLGVDARLMRRIFRLTEFYFLNKFCFAYRMQSQSICRSRLKENRNWMAGVFSGRKRQKPLTYYISGKWISAKVREPRTVKTLEWRLNFHAWQAERHGWGPRKAPILLRADDRALARMTDRERFRKAFLRPLGQALESNRKTILDEAGLVSDGSKGLLIFSREVVRMEAILSFLNRDFYYYSSSNPILYRKGSKAYGEALVDPLELWVSPGSSRRGKHWGEFWNPLLKKNYLNVCYYRTYLIGDTCPIKGLLFIETDETLRNARTRRISGNQAAGMYRSTLSRQSAGNEFEQKEAAWKIIEKTPAFLMKTPRADLKKAVLKFVF